MPYALTKQQVDELFVFCKKHHVHHYDVQRELVDHLANAIEKNIEMNPEMSFEESLAGIYASFGIKGFAEIVNQRMASMEKYCRKERWRIYLSYFTWPKAAVTLCIYFLLSLAIKYLPPYERSVFYACLFLAVMAFYVFALFETYFIFKKQKKKLLITSHGELSNILPYWLGYFALEIYRYKTHIFDSTYIHIGFIDGVIANVLFIMLLALALSYRQLILQLDKLIRKDYPEVFIAE